MEAESYLQQQTGYRPIAVHNIQHHQAQLPLPLPHQQHQHQQQHQPLPLPHNPHLSHTLASQAGLDLNKYDDGSVAVYPDLRQLQEVSNNAQAYHSANAFEQASLSQHHNHTIPHHVQQPPPASHSNGSPHTPRQSNGTQFGMMPSASAPLQHGSISRLQQEEDVFGTVTDSQEQQQGTTGHLGTKIVTDPPNLAAWRQKLFDVNEMIMLSEEEYVYISILVQIKAEKVRFQTYFPHVDNVYSHRSTQKYKRKPFVSHYWDCRLKGRPPGTPKSDDPNKKKRKRTARERDLCDVKIKITEYFPNAMTQPGFEGDGSGAQGSMDSNQVGNIFNQGQPGAGHSQIQPPFGTLPPDNPLDRPHPGANGQRYWTIQRVNGNGGNGKGDGVAGPHKHTLPHSDSVKKSSVERFRMKEAKEKKKTEVSCILQFCSHVEKNARKFQATGNITLLKKSPLSATVLF